MTTWSRGIRRAPTIRTSRLAVWAWRLVAFAIPVLILGLLAHRNGHADAEALLAVLASGFGLAALGVMMALVSFVVIWQTGAKGVRTALGAFMLGLLVSTVPAAALVVGLRLPLMNDITTDPILPPEFLALAPARTNAGAAVPYNIENNWPKQTEAYPRIVPLRFEADFDEAVTLVEDALAEAGWVVETIRRRDGEPRQITFEAVARTFIVGFPDDVAIRLSEGRDFIRMDMRSASRYGRHDLGANARRITSFLEAFDDRLRQRGRV
ncbi:MAG: DUF1499 domain-containing protein [Pseudomonadota bacterium]